ncbi:hypothetical protein [Myxococcus sp. CA039A]|uniref:hypothetical protein n=1 Tax=Myxococcus sp. CA039A TaxID=2741737 RepID=UPI00157A4C83|nr:hypothetical protein [Myxococcus sp. CA039A]NTX56844.1 hypothetical protein [Myxococcus sp. CA039A]
MRRTSVIRRVMAVSLALMLGACGTTPTRSSVAGPTGPHDLARYALAFEQRPDGQVAHAWIPLKDFDLTKFQHTLSTRHLRRNIVRVSTSGLNEYCAGRHEQCVNDCLASSRPFVIGHRKYMDTAVAHRQKLVVSEQLHGGFD